MKKVLLILIVGFSSLNSHAQSSSAYIEFTINDTMSVLGEKFKLLILCSTPNSVTYEFDTTAASMDMDSDDATEKKCEQDMIALIKKHKLDTVALSTIDIKSAPMIPYFAGAGKPIKVVHITSYQSCISFIKDLKATAGLSGHIIQTESSAEAEAEKILCRKIMAAARKKAEWMAEIAGKKAGQVLLIKDDEITAEENTWAFYSALATMGQEWGSFGLDFGTRLHLAKKITFRFSLD